MANSTIRATAEPLIPQMTACAASFAKIAARKKMTMKTGMTCS